MLAGGDDAVAARMSATLRTKNVARSSAVKPDDWDVLGGLISNFSLDQSCLPSPLHSAKVTRTDILNSRRAYVEK